MWLGGTADVPFATVATAMVGVHAVIGIGEAVITALAVASIVLAVPARRQSALVPAERAHERGQPWRARRDVQVHT